MAKIQIRGVSFNPMLNASGARGFFGEGYWFHWVWYVFTLGFFNWAMTTFVAKSATLNARPGNMPLKSDGLTPREFFPRCIYLGWAFSKAVTLNAVGLSNRGAAWLLAKKRWQRRAEPFFLSFMPVGMTKEERFEELCTFLDQLIERVHEFRSAFGLQLNLSCPNTGHATDDLPSEALAWLDEIDRRKSVGIFMHGMPVLLKVNVFLRAEQALKIGAHPRCDGFVCSNTIPWKDLNDLGFDTAHHLGMEISPLVDLGGGGFSGPTMVWWVCNWIGQVRKLGYSGAIIGENGIRRPGHAIKMLEAGANGVGVGSMAMIRPWMLFPTTLVVHRWVAKNGGVR